LGAFGKMVVIVSFMSVTDLEALSYITKDPAEVLATHEQQKKKKKKYLDECL